MALVAPHNKLLELSLVCHAFFPIIRHQAFAFIQIDIYSVGDLAKLIEHPLSSIPTYTQSALVVGHITPTSPSIETIHWTEKKFEIVLMKFTTLELLQISCFPARLFTTDGFFPTVLQQQQRLNYLKLSDISEILPLTVTALIASVPHFVDLHLENIKLPSRMTLQERATLSDNFPSQSVQKLCFKNMRTDLYLKWFYHQPPTPLPIRSLDVQHAEIVAHTHISRALVVWSNTLKSLTLDNITGKCHMYIKTLFEN